MERILHSIPAGAERISVGRSKMYELIAAGEIQTVTIGTRRLIPESSLQAFAARLSQEQTTPGSAA